jgi:hypothetical protein
MIACAWNLPLTRRLTTAAGAAGAAAAGAAACPCYLTPFLSSRKKKKKKKKMPIMLALATAAAAAAASSGGPGSHSVPLFRHHALGTPAPMRAANGSAFPTGGNVWPVAIYWITLGVGTPPKSFPVAIDSGSMTLDIQGPGCANCPKFAPNNAYQPAASSTSKPCSILTCRLPKTFSNTYQTCDLSNPDAPCTIKGNNYEDMVSLGGLGPVPVTFGAITSQTSNFDQFKQIDGVVGLAGAGGKGNVFESLRAAGYIDQDMFGMCLAQGTKSNGTFTVGALDPRLYTGEMAWAKNLGGMGGLYEMPLSGISVGGKAIKVARKSAILDSGTNVLLVPSPIFDALTEAFEGYCQAGAKLKGICDVPAGGPKSLLKGGCWSINPTEAAAFPTLTLGITAKGLSMPPSTYLRTGDPACANAAPGSVSFGVRDTGATGFLIVGDTTMENYYVAFDRKENRIGWAKRTDACGSV